jgi:hypothetical protein
MKTEIKASGYQVVGTRIPDYQGAGYHQIRTSGKTNPVLPDKPDSLIS